MPNRGKIGFMKKAPENGGFCELVVLFEELTDLLVRVDHRADGNIVVDGGDEVCHILGDIDLVEPFALQKLRAAVGQVRTKYAADVAVCIRLVKLLQTVGEDGISSIGKNALCTALLQCVGNIEHGLAGGDDIIGNEYILTLNAVAEVLVCYDRISAADNTGVITALVEHTHIHAELGGIEHVSAECALVGRYDHEGLLGRLEDPSML